ncbi:vesicle-associated membrane protein 1 isoform X2 [Dendrobates tinctorius]|uniref:vesicle-associated membrane protein 1 isoform X2 n=1 Tax=Dendrobates tinctorius TaxID=92724 RepID=UPI003CCA3E80
MSLCRVGGRHHCVWIWLQSWTAPADTAGDMSPASPQYTPCYSSPETDVTSNPRIRLTQEQIDEVVRIMEANVHRVVEVDVSELEGADSGSGGGYNKMLMMIGLIAAVLLIIICVLIISSFHPH